MSEEQTINHLGVLAKNLPALHTIEYKVGFNLHDNTFLQKMIPKDLLEKGVRIIPEDYFRGLVFLSYFSEIMSGDYACCTNLVTLSKALRKHEKETGVDGTASYLHLGAVVVETGLYAKEHLGTMPLQDIVTRYEQKMGAVDFAAPTLRAIEPYYLGIGQMLYDLVPGEKQPLLSTIQARADVWALVFTECVLSTFPHAPYKSAVEELEAKHDYLQASLASINGLQGDVTLDHLEKMIHHDETHS